MIAVDQGAASCGSGCVNGTPDEGSPIGYSQSGSVLSWRKKVTASWSGMSCTAGRVTFAATLANVGESSANVLHGRLLSAVDLIAVYKRLAPHPNLVTLRNPHGRERRSSNYSGCDGGRGAGESRFVMLWGRASAGSGRGGAQARAAPHPLCAPIE
eukprot:6192948-Pleurochrysis_carterae.AAC.3